MAIELDNSFTVPVPPEQAWDVLLDVERIAPCLPGASVTSVTGDEVEGQVKVKLGPLSLAYKGTAKFTGKDPAARTFALEGAGRETKGAGTASASVQATLQPGDSAGSTLGSIHTSLTVTGRPAQFGRSLLPEVSGKLIAQFATNLETLITSDAVAAAPAIPSPPAEVTAPDAAPVTPDTTPAPAVPVPDAPAGRAAATADDSLDAFRYVVVPVLRRVAPVVGAVAAGAVLFAVVRRLSGKKSS